MMEQIQHYHCTLTPKLAELNNSFYIEQLVEYCDGDCPHCAFARSENSFFSDELNDAPAHETSDLRAFIHLFALAGAICMAAFLAKVVWELIW